jgi:hypothetical protein
MSSNQTYASRIRGQFGIQLFKNSFFIILNKLVVAGSGFVFWLLAANFYSSSTWPSSSSSRRSWLSSSSRPSRPCSSSISR